MKILFLIFNQGRNCISRPACVKETALFASLFSISVGVLNLLLRVFTENFLLGIFMSTIDDEWLKNTCLLKQGSDTHTKTFITWFLWVKFSEKFEIATEMPFRDRIISLR